VKNSATRRRKRSGLFAVLKKICPQYTPFSALAIFHSALHRMPGRFSTVFFFMNASRPDWMPRSSTLKRSCRFSRSPRRIWKPRNGSFITNGSTVRILCRNTLRIFQKNRERSKCRVNGQQRSKIS